MKKKLFIAFAVTASIVMSAFGATGCSNKNKYVETLPETFVNETLGFELTGDVDMPAPDASSHRGEEIENLVTLYAKSYENDEYLKEDVKLFRQWQWEALYNSLAQKAKDNPAYLNTYRLQAEAYLVKSQYEAALSALDKVLKYHHDDVYALGLSAYVQNILGNTAQRDARLSALNNVSPKCRDDLVELMTKVTGWINEDHGTEKIDGTGRLPYDAIGILGVAPTASGQLQGSGAARVKAAFKAAYYSNGAKIIPSGGAIDTEYSEAKVMGDYIVRNSASIAESLELNPEDFCVYGDDVLLDEQARDTVGNAMGICDIMDANDLHNLLIIASEDQVMRAEVIFNAYIDANGLDITVTSHSAGGNSPSANQTRYSYVCAATAYGLFTKDDYAEHAKYVIDTTNGLTRFEGKVVVDKTASDKGETVSYSAIPAAGYEVDAVEVKTSSGTAVNADNGSFTMPAESVIISAKFKKIAGTVKLDFFNGDNFGTNKNGITSISDALKACENDIKAVNSGLVSVTDNIAEDPMITGNNALGYGKMGGFGLAAGGRIGGFKLNFKDDYKISKIQVTAVRFAENEGHLQVNGIEPTSGTLQGEANVFDPSYYVEYSFATPTNVLDFRTVADTADGATNYGRVIIYSVTLFLEDASKVDTVYSVTVNPVDNGTVTVPYENYVAGATVTLTAEGDKGYFLDTLKVMNGGEEVEVTGNTFVMPAGDVTVEAAFISRLSAETDIALTGDKTYNKQIVGSAVMDKDAYAVGEKATPVIKAGAGFVLDTVTVKTESGREIQVNGDYSFTFPDENVTVTATFKVKEGTTTLDFFNATYFDGGKDENGKQMGTTKPAEAAQKYQTEINAMYGENFVTMPTETADTASTAYGKYGGYGMGANGGYGYFTMQFAEGRKIAKIIVNAAKNTAIEGDLKIEGAEKSGSLTAVNDGKVFGIDPESCIEFAFETPVNGFKLETDGAGTGKGTYGRVIVYSITIIWAE